MSFNLVFDPWVPVVGPDGGETLSLAGLARRVDEPIRLVDGETDVEPLTAAASMRLLLACYAASQTARQTMAVWLDAHQDWFDLFGDHPFAQCALISSRFEDVALPAVALPMFTATNGPVLLDHQHNHVDVRWTPAQAARLMLVRSMVGTAQRQPFKGDVFGPQATFGKNTPCLTRPFLWVEGPTLADSLAQSAVPGLGQGTFHPTWPDKWTPGTVHEPRGPLDVLTWPGRAILLRQDVDGMVDQVAFAAGAVWDQTDPGLQPNTLVTNDPGRGLMPVRPAGGPGWTRRLLAGWISGVHGTLADQLHHTHGAHMVLRWAGLAADKGRVDAAMDHSLPLPVVDDDTIRGWLDTTSTVWTDTLRRMRKAVGQAWPAGDQIAAIAAAQIGAGLGQRIDPLSAEVSAGQTSPAQAERALRQTAGDVLQQLADSRFAEHLQQAEILERSFCS